MRLGQTSFIYFVSKIIATIAGFAATIIFARVLGAETLGIYSLALGVTAWVTLPTTVGIGGAINKRLSEGSDVGEYMTAGAVIMGFMLFLVIAAVIVGEPLLNDYIGSPVTQYVLLLVVISTLQDYISAVLQGRHRVHIVGLLTPIGAIGRSVFQITAIVMGLGVAGLLLAHALGTSVSILLGILAISLVFKIPQRKHFENLASFAQFSWLNQMRARTFNKLDIIVLGFFVSSNLVGVYTISWNIASVLGIFAASLSATLFPELSKLSAENRDDDVRELIEKSLAYAGLIHIPGLVGALILGRRMLRIYGTEFISGYAVLVILILAYLVHSYNKQLLTALEGLDHPEKAFRANLALIVSNVVLNVALVYSFGWIGAAVATTLSVCFSFILGYWYLTNLIDFAVPIRMAEKQIFAAGVMGAVIYLLLKAQQNLSLIANNVFVLGILISTGATIYFAVLALLSSQFRDVVVDNIPSNLLSI